MAGNSPGDHGWLEQSEQVRLLLDIAQAVTSTLDLEELYGLALDRLRDLIPFAGAVVAVGTGERWQLVAARRPMEIGEGDVAPRIPGWNRSNWVKTLVSGTAFYVNDIRGDDPRAVEYRSYLSEPIEVSPMRYFRSVLEIPLMLNGETVGEISVSHAEPGYFTDAHVELVSAVGSFLAIGIENARLFQKAEERANALTALLELSQSVSSTLDLDELYRVALDRLRDLIPYAGATIALNTPEGPRMVAARRPTPISEGRITRRPGWHQTNFMRSLASGRTVVVQDIRGNDPLAVEYRDHLTMPIEQSAARYFRSVLAVPLRAGDRVIGDLGVVHERPNFFTVEHEDLVLSVANHIAIGIENARLFLEARERTRELASLLEVSRHVAGSRDTESLARVVLDEFRNVMDYGNASLVLREGPLLRIAYASTHDGPSPRPEVIGVTFEIANAGAIWDTLQRGEPLLVDDNRDGGHWSQAYQQVVGDLYDTAFAGVRSWMGVPLRVRGETIGFLTVSAPEPQQFRQSHTDLAMAFAAQVSVAFENAELLQQAQAVAATEERQRLARELHDSVSQALYGIALGARTARTQLDRDPAAAKEPVDYVLSLAEAGLAEMRALIFELRPESLETEGLVAALEKQIAATRARYGFEVNATLGEEPALPAAAREAFYRIAQEALHNIVKHARPSTVDVALASGDRTVELVIRDDGVGFDPAGEFPGHLGLQSMRERASRVGASLTIDSSIGEGTSVRLVLAAG